MHMIKMPSSQHQDQNNFGFGGGWHRNQCDDPFPIESPWATSSSSAGHDESRPGGASGMRIPATSAFNFSYNQPLRAPGTEPSVSAYQKMSRPDGPSWCPQQSDDPLQNFRNSMQSGELSKLAAEAHSQMFNGNPGRRSSLSSAGSSDSTESPATPTTTWSAVVQKNPRPVKHRKARPTKTFTVTLAACCATPKLKVTCGCCNEESFVKVKEELKPRLIPVSTSQLGFCRFCQTNGDPPEIYQGHSLRSDEGKVTCPVLREYNCPICNNGGGDFAHTIKYCPMARKSKPNN